MSLRINSILGSVNDIQPKGPEPGAELTAGLSLKPNYMLVYNEPLYGNMPQVGEYMATYSSHLSNTAFVADRVYYVPIVISYTLKIDRLGIYVTTGLADNSVLMGIYSFERGILGAKLVETDEVSVATAGLKEGTVNVALPAGVFMFALLLEGGIRIRKNTVDIALMPHTAATETSNMTHYYESQAWASGLPTTPSSLTLSAGDTPRIWGRVG